MNDVIKRDVRKAETSETSMRNERFMSLMSSRVLFCVQRGFSRPRHSLDGQQLHVEHERRVGRDDGRVSLRAVREVRRTYQARPLA